MIVQQSDFLEIIEKLSKPGVYSLDTETTGLRAYHEDRLFSIIISNGETSYYFNFQPYSDVNENTILPREFLSEMKLIFENPQSLWFLFNAKFDMSMLAKEGLFIEGAIHCGQAIARIENNTHLKYSLDLCAARIGLTKSNAVEEWITRFKVYDWETIPGRKQPMKKKYFHRVPFDIIEPYGEIDAKITYELGMHQIKAITEFSNSMPENQPTPLRVMENERRFTRTCFNMEQTGVLIDEEYCKKAAEFEKENMQRESDEFKRLTGEVLVNSAKSLAPIFKALGEVFPETEKGNDSFTKDVLDTFKSPAASVVRQFRKAEKRRAYFSSYLYHADKYGVIHASIKQYGAEHGRVSYGDPNFQNVPKRGEDTNEFPVRRAIIPRQDFVLVSIDYNSMEYVMLADYAGQLDLNKKIKEGLDPHTACQELMEISDRNVAKTMNFLKIYGGGSQKLATALGISLAKAKEYSSKFWEKLPQVANFIQKVSKTAEKRGFIVNWLGRICRFPDPKFAYIAPNHLISGGCADVVKVAMNRLDTFLSNKKSRMLIQIHDELVFEIHDTEVDILPDIVEIMETTYPCKHLPLTVSVEHSYKSWFDKVEGIPVGKKAGKFISGESNAGLANAP